MREVEDILLSKSNSRSKSKGNRPCVLREEKRARAGSRNDIQESPGFSKNIKKSGSLIMGEGGLKLVYIYIIFILLVIYILLI
jgi:hypothetical protein